MNYQKDAIINSGIALEAIRSRFAWSELTYHDSPEN